MQGQTNEIKILSNDDNKIKWNLKRKLNAIAKYDICWGRWNAVVNTHTSLGTLLNVKQWHHRLVMLNHHFITQYKILKLIVTLLLLLLLQISHLCTWINAGGSLLSSREKGELSLLAYSMPYETHNMANLLKIDFIRGCFSLSFPCSLK